MTGVTTTHPETTTFVRNAQDLPTSVTDRNGNTIVGHLRRQRQPADLDRRLQQHLDLHLQPFNEVLTATPPSGSATPETINTYDANGNLLTTAHHPSSGSNLTTTDTRTVSRPPAQWAATATRGRARVDHRPEGVLPPPSPTTPTAT